MLKARMAVVAIGLCTAVTIAPSGSDAQVGRWDVRVMTDPITDQGRGIASIESDVESRLSIRDLGEAINHTAGADLHGSRRFMLMVKCDFDRNRMYVSLSFPRGINRSSSEITYRFDQAEPETIRWAGGRSTVNLFDDHLVEAFVIRARRANRIAFRITPVGAGQAESTTFSGVGSSAAITRAYRACGQAVPSEQQT